MLKIALLEDFHVLARVSQLIDYNNKEFHKNKKEVSISLIGYKALYKIPLQNLSLTVLRNAYVLRDVKCPIARWGVVGREDGYRKLNAVERAISALRTREMMDISE